MKTKIFGTILVLLGILFCICGIIIVYHTPSLYAQANTSLDIVNLSITSYKAGVLEGAGISLSAIGLLLSLFGENLK